MLELFWENCRKVLKEIFKNLDEIWSKYEWKFENISKIGVIFEK